MEQSQSGAVALAERRLIKKPRGEESEYAGYQSKAAAKKEGNKDEK